MSTTEKDRLVKMLTDTLLDTKKVLDGIDLELIVYTEGDWRVRDILGHIATWEIESTKSIRAFLEGSEYSIPDLDDEEHDFNQREVNEQRKLSDEDLIKEREAAREELKVVINEIPEEKFAGELLFPWGGETGSIAQLVEFMVEHDEEHRDEIVKAVKGL